MGLGFGDIIGVLFGSEDDWLGSYENAWDANEHWGAGIYSDITCQTESGSIGLRLWFTISVLD